MADDNKPTYLEQSDDDLIPFNVKPSTVEVELSAQAKEHINHWLLRYPPEHKRSGVYEALRYVQQEHGHLTVPLMDAVARHLELPPIAVYEVAAFYTMYHLNPVGKYVIDVCTNISCTLNGADEVLDYFKKKLGINLNETTTDGRFTLKEVECLGACVAPPVCMIGKKYYEKLTPEKIDKILTNLK